MNKEVKSDIQGIPIKEYFQEINENKKEHDELYSLPQEIKNPLLCYKCKTVKREKDFFNLTSPKKDYKACKACRKKFFLGKQDYAEDMSKVYLRTKMNAEVRGLGFSLTLEEFLRFYQKPCYYCGEKVLAVSLDRTDNSKGYFLGNVVSCCWPCNRMKNAMNIDGFINKVISIYKNIKADELLSYTSYITAEDLKVTKPFNY